MVSAGVCYQLSRWSIWSLPFLFQKTRTVFLCDSDAGIFTLCILIWVSYDLSGLPQSYLLCMRKWKLLPHHWNISLYENIQRDNAWSRQAQAKFNDLMVHPLGSPRHPLQLASSWSVEDTCVSSSRWVGLFKMPILVLQYQRWRVFALTI